jgi:methionyl aminopeptidase
VITLKSPAEIDRLRESGRIVALTFRHIEPMVVPGITTEEIDQEIQRFIVSQGGRPAFKGIPSSTGVPFPGNSCISIDEEVVHGIPDGRKLEAGQIVGIDIGVEKGGYYGDAARTYKVGTVSSLKDRLVRITKEALDLAIREARVDRPLGAISNAIQIHVEAAGFSVVRDLVGHGIGRNLHEPPQIPNFGSPNHGPKLRVGMTLAIEPMVNAGKWQVRFLPDSWRVVTLDGSPSAHFENTIAITDSTAEILTEWAEDK